MGLGKDDPRLALVGDRDATSQEQRSGAMFYGSTRPDGGGGGGGGGGITDRVIRVGIGCELWNITSNGLNLILFFCPL
jgi:hypothetical protein